jgi:hypothetical protein
LKAAYIRHMVKNTDPPHSVAAGEQRPDQSPEPTEGGADTAFSPERGWGWIRGPVSVDSDSETFFVKFPKSSEEDDAAAKIYFRIDQELAAEEARADRLLRLYGL